MSLSTNYSVVFQEKLLYWLEQKFLLGSFVFKQNYSLGLKFNPNLLGFVVWGDFSSAASDYIDVFTYYN